MSKSWSDVRWALAYWISRSLSVFARLVPTKVWYTLSAPVAEACFVVMRRHRRNLIANLVRVVGPDQAEATARRVFHAYARYVIDLYQLPQLGSKAIAQRLRYDQWPRLNETLEQGNGTVFVTLHLGQAELGAATVASSGRQVNVIAEKFDYGPMDDFIQGLRRKLGMTIIPANKAIPGLLRCLKRGEVLAMLFDGVPPGEGMKVRFFGAEAEMSPAPARIALRTGSRLLTAVVTRDADEPMKLAPYIDFDVLIERTGDEEADVRALTQAIATSFEGFVRCFPDQWFAFRPVWASGDKLRDGTSEDGERWKLWALRIGALLGARLPRLAAYGMARLAGDLAYLVRSQARQDVQDNMGQVMGPEAGARQVRQAAREVFRNVARYYVDLIRLTRGDPRDLVGREVWVHNEEQLTSRLAAGQAVVLTTAHYANPELALAVVSRHLDLDVLGVVEPLPPTFARLMNRIRDECGMHYVQAGYRGMAKVVRHLRAHKSAAIVSDRDIQQSGIVIEVFGRPASVPTGAVELALRTSAALLPVYSRRTARGMEVVFDEEVLLQDSGDARKDAAANMEALFARHEKWIKEDPGQWIVLERFWRDK